MTVGALVRNEARLLRHDPLPAVVLIAMPIVLMSLLTPALRVALRFEGYADATGAEQTVPGMVSVFSYFAVAVVGFALFREHGWRTWWRLRAVGASPGQLLVAKLALPAGMLAAQHVVLFGFGTTVLDLRVAGSWAALALVSVAFVAMVVALGLAAAAALDTIQQVNAVTNLGAMVIGGFGGGFVPVDVLPSWVQPLAPASPTYWAMDGYRAVILRGGGLTDVVTPVLVLAAFAVLFALVALWRLQLDAPKRTWG